MAKGSWEATDESSLLIPADKYRDLVTIQLISGDPVAIGIGEVAVYGEGMMLLSVGDYLGVNGYQAKEAISVICDTGKVAAGSFQTALPSSGREA